MREILVPIHLSGEFERLCWCNANLENGTWSRYMENNNFVYSFDNEEDALLFWMSFKDYEEDK